MRKDNEDPVQDASTVRKEGADFLIVGIGASAGGIKALKAFFGSVQPDSGMAYVVILHLSPEFESHLAEILQTVTTVPVTQIREDRVRVQADNVYVIPPNKSLAMADGFLALSSVESYEERRAPIDIFFRTLADSNDGRAVSVILSGTGSDGSMGMRRIKERGGIVLVQDPQEADYDDMPRNSIAQGLVDFVLPVSRIPEQIVHYRDQQPNIHIAVKQEVESKEEEHEKALRDVFTQLRIKTGHDFSNYKRATILRRIERRMNVRELDDLPGYAAFMTADKEEPQILLKELLISVTNFFRDRPAFDALEKQVLPKIFAGKGPEDVVRIWASACATGEEAYSLAILCAERLSALAEPPAIQIFATDIDSVALTIAREGYYSNSDVADVSPDRLRKFFVKEGAGFRIRRELRETILFARHNIIKDPPFSHLDLATCRNLLIYLNRTAQGRVMETFHFALNPGGYLFLGSSETIDGSTNLYTTIDREACLFQSRSVVTRPLLPIPESKPSARFPDFREMLPPVPEEKPASRMSVAGLHYQLLELHGPPSILVNAEHDIMHISRNAGRYLQLSGEPSVDLLQVIRPELRLELRTALYNAAQTGAAVHIANLPVQINDAEELTSIAVKPVLGELDAARGFILIQFEQTGSQASSQPVIQLSAANEPIARHLEDELLRTRSQLRQTAEQYEVQTEEFKASNEELQAINEELRSAAEELETSKEELQSVNEELTTVNQELKVKIDELSQTNNDFKNLINATNIGTIFLDRTFSVNLFTPAACEIFNLKQADYGRPLSDITSRLEKTDILNDVESVMLSLQPAEREVRTITGKDYLMRILPYRTFEDHINGVVVTFIDITARNAAEHALRISEQRMRALFTQARAGVAQTDLDGRFIMVNKRYCALLGFSEAELLGRSMAEFVFLEDQDAHSRQLQDLRERAVPFEAETRYVCKDGSTIWLHNSITRISDRENEAYSVLTVSIDITQQKASERQKDEFIGIASHELRTPVTSIKAFVEILQEKFRRSGDAEAESTMAKLDAQVDRMTMMIMDLLDTTRLTEGRLPLGRTPLDLGELILETVDMMQYTARGQKLVTALDPLPIFEGDRERIRQILVNLIGNAIKYAPNTEQILITADANAAEIRICVQDFGNGLPKDLTERIFERFFRANEAGTKAISGMGLGLYISSELAKMHGGMIRVQSEPGNGAKFCLVLPANAKQAYAGTTASDPRDR